MPDGRPASRPSLLYLTAASAQADGQLLPLSSRLYIGVLSRDFEVSVAIVGSVTTVAMNRLRLDLGPLRVTGGFETSAADRAAPSALRAHMIKRVGTDTVSARLQNVIQHKAKDFDAVVVDALVAWPYRPVGVGTVAYILDSLESEQPGESRLLGHFQRKKLIDYEIDALASADRVYAPEHLALALSHRGITMKSLRGCFTKQPLGLPTLAEVDFNLTEQRLGYFGYLSDSSNLASLYWFLDQVWPVLRAVMPKLELHLAGGAPTAALKARVANEPGLVLHGGGTDAPLLAERCRVVIEPLLYEDHIDAKLVNAMARGIPVVTTKHAIQRAHADLSGGVIAASTREQMVLAIRRLLTDGRAWNSLVAQGTHIARAQLPAFELVHRLRRGLAEALATPRSQ